MHLTVIAKEPVPGKVKTRLCPPFTPEQAAAVAEAALRDTLDAVVHSATGDVEPVLLLDGNRPRFVPSDMRVVSQCDGGLDARLAHGFAELGPGVIVGMETPGAVPSLRAALDHLRHGNDVLAPALDGGYWAIGLAAGVDPHRALLGVPMSVDYTFAAQLRRLFALRRRVRLLQTARDLDDLDDLVACAATSSGRLGAVAAEVLATG